MEKGKMIYLDSTVFLYSILDIGTKGEKSRILIRSIEAGQEKAATSALTFDEVSWIVKKEKGFDTSLQAASAFLNIPNIILIDTNMDVLFNAYELMKKYRINPRDAIHASSAILKGIKIIVSEDGDFDKIKEIKRKSLLDF